MSTGSVQGSQQEQQWNPVKELKVACHHDGHNCRPDFVESGEGIESYQLRRICPHTLLNSGIR